MPQESRPEIFDAIVVGSGATGGWAAKQLSEAGLKVALLEAGRNISPKEFTEHMPGYKLQYRDMSPEIARTRPVQKQCYACMEYNYDWFVDDLQNPYSTPPGQAVHLAAAAHRRRPHPRVGPAELPSERPRFQGRFCHDGYGQDWPFSYQDLAPYYDIVERYVGISGARREQSRASRRPFPAAHEDDLRRSAHARASAGEVRAHRHHRPHRHPHPESQWSLGLPLLRTVRARLHHILVLQQPVHHRCGCAQKRQLQADDQRGGGACRYGRCGEPRRAASPTSIGITHRRTRCAPAP